jgi:hypothetical protein
MSILEGKLDDIIDARKYDSAIVTTYTIDLIFVKHIFVPALQSKRIINITILADQKELDLALRGQENLIRMADPAFIVVPARSSRLFHPKVMLFIGKKEGLCIIGSGNLSHSGMGGNNEIWGAFHYSAENDTNKHIFQSVWNFLMNCMPELTGTGELRSREWITNNAPWLKNIISETYEDTSLPTAVFTNTEEDTIWGNVVKRLSDKEITEVLIASPFYDEKGALLQELKMRYPHAGISMVYDKHGTIPKISEPFEKLRCYAWQDIVHKVGFESFSARRLHAKILLFKEKTGVEHLLFGSANASNAGLGINSIKNSNVELSVYAHSSSGLFKSVGIDLGGIESKAVSEITVDYMAQMDEPTTSSNNNSLRVIYAEQSDKTVLLVLNKNAEGSTIDLKFLDRDGLTILEKIIHPSDSTVISINLNEEEFAGENGKMYFVSLADEYKSIIFQAKTLSFGNPNSRAESFRGILSDIGSVDFGALHSHFMKIFVEYVENREIKSGDGNSSRELSNKQNQQSSEDEDYVGEENFIEKKRGVPNLASDRFISDGIYGIFHALNQFITVPDYEEASSEAHTDDGSTEMNNASETDSNSKKKSRGEVKRDINGYRYLLKRVLQYYDRFVRGFDEVGNNESVRKKLISQPFISYWLLVAAIVLHVILNDAKKKGISDTFGDDEAMSLDEKTTIAPFPYKKKLSINDIVSKSIPRIVGRITASKQDLKNFLDVDQRIDGCINILAVIHLQYRKEEERETFIRLCNSVLRLFQIKEDGLLTVFRERFSTATRHFLELQFKESDWRYYSNFKYNYEVFVRFI